MNTTIGTEIGDWTGWCETSVVEAHAEATRSRFGGDGVAAWAWLCDEASDEEIEALGGERLPSAHDIGLEMGREIGEERVREGVALHLVEQARESLDDAMRYGTETLADALRVVAGLMTGDEAGLSPSDCYGIDDALYEAGYSRADQEAGYYRADQEARRAATKAAAAVADEIVAVEAERMADEIDEIVRAHLDGIEGGLDKAIADLGAGGNERAACGLSDEGWQIPSRLARYGVCRDDLDQAVLATARACAEF